MTRKRARLRGVGRWGVFLCTALLLISIPVSVWVAPHAHVTHHMGISKVWSVHLIEGRLLYFSISFDPNKGRTSDTQKHEEIESTWRFDFGTGPIGNNTVQSGSGWWKLPEFHNDYGIPTVDVPLVYLSVVMVGWSWWLVRGVKRRRRLVGCCVGCGYSLEGLDGGVCPECGEGGV